MNLEQAREAFRQWLHMPDTGALDAMLGTVAANRLEGDPVWMLLVGPPGGGKSELLNAVSKLSDSHPTGTLTEAALLSGTPKKEQDKGAKGGLLHSIGERGIIVCKDFGSVLSMHTDARSRVLAALREVYDGEWTRHVGTDGGRTLHWEGRVGLVGGCTPSIDRHHAVMGAMGERFTLYRLPKIDGKVQARAAMKHAGKERQMRGELAQVAAEILDGLAEPQPLSDDEMDYLIDLAAFVVRARSAVERDGYSREIELVSEPEAPGRLIIVLARLLQGLDAIGCDRPTAFEVTTKAAMDSIPALRMTVLDALLEHGQLDTNQAAAAARHPSTTTRRALEDLVAHHLVDMQRQETAGPNPPHLWTLTADARTALERLETGFSRKAARDSSHVPEKPYTPRCSKEAAERDNDSRLFGNVQTSTNGHHDTSDSAPSFEDAKTEDLAYYETLQPGASE